MPITSNIKGCFQVQVPSPGSGAGLTMNRIQNTMQYQNQVELSNAANWFYVSPKSTVKPLSFPQNKSEGAN